MSTGTVKWFNAEKGFGFIAPLTATALTFSCTTRPSRRTDSVSSEESQRVEFDIVQGNKGPQAEAVRPV